MASSNGISSSKFRRLTQAALSADHALYKVDVMTEDVNALLNSVNRIDPSIHEVETTLLHIDEEISSILEIKVDVENVLAAAQRILDLVEWVLTPAFAAKATAERAILLARNVQRVVRQRVAITAGGGAEVVDLAEVRRLVG